MKYAPLDEKMGKFLKENGYQSFDPYLFTEEITRKIFSLLIDAYDPTIEIESSYVNHIQLSATKLNISKNINVLSLFLSIIAFALSVAALMSVRGLI